MANKKNDADALPDGIWKFHIDIQWDIGLGKDKNDYNGGHKDNGDDDDVGIHNEIWYLIILYNLLFLFCF